MTVPILMILGGIAFGAFFLWYTRVKVDAWWYGTFTGDLYVYLAPPFGFAATAAGLFNLFQEINFEPSRIVFGFPFAIILVWFMISVFSVMLGLPKIPFLLPKWMRERRREEKRLARE